MSESIIVGMFFSAFFESTKPRSELRMSFRSERGA
jgi:hypothetical protein